MNISGYNFEGPWSLGQSFNDVPGIYVVYTSQQWLDIGETDKLGSRINGDNHERKPQWISNSGGLPINIAFLRIDEAKARLDVESQLRLLLAPVCGEK